METVKQKRDRLSQWFTPEPLAQRMQNLVRESGYGRGVARILEPAVGTGNLVSTFPYATTVDIDPKMRPKVVGDFLDMSRDDLGLEPHERFDCCVMNPPYEYGLDLAFVHHAMTLSARIVALLRVNFLCGKGRYDAVWSNPTWGIEGLYFLSRRPRFSGEPGSPRHDFVVVDMSAYAFPDETKVDWW